MKAVIIPPEGPPGVIDLPPKSQLSALQGEVGGFIEAQDPEIAGVVVSMYFNEEGKLDEEKYLYNPLATFLHRQGFGSRGRMAIPGDWIAGTAVILGDVDSKGENTECPKAVIDYLVDPTPPIHLT